eukprot:4067458-Amphidinium_carterae.1
MQPIQCKLGPQLLTDWQGDVRTSVSSVEEKRGNPDSHGSLARGYRPCGAGLVSVYHLRRPPSPRWQEANIFPHHCAWSSPAAAARRAALHAWWDVATHKD